MCKPTCVDLRISAEKAAVHARGPANCTSGDHEDPSGVSSRPPSQSFFGASSIDALVLVVAATDDDVDDNQCAGVLDGGVDAISPLKLWDAIMKNYKVAQICDREIAKLDAKTDLTEKEKQCRRGREGLGKVTFARNTSETKSALS